MKAPMQHKVPRSGEHVSRDASAPSHPSAGVVGLGVATHLETTKESVGLFLGRGREKGASALAVLAESDLIAHNAVCKGLPGWTALHLCETATGPLAAEDILRALGVGARAWRKIKRDPDVLLDVHTSDRVYRLVSVRAVAVDTLGSPNAADEWLAAAAVGLEHRKPIDLLGTEPGTLAVKTLLQRMKFGVYT